jgi:uncharacterized membrane protein
VPARRSAAVASMPRRDTSRSTTSCRAICVSHIVLPLDLMVPSLDVI